MKKVSADSTGFYYSYDTHNQLAQVDERSIANGALLRGLYGYNGLGQRVSKDNGSKITHYIYGLDGALIAETNDTGTPLREYVYLNGQPLAAWYSEVSGTVQTEALYYYHNDHLGTPQAMTDSSGTKVWEADYQPFGKASITLSNIENNLRFPGQYYDAETGLHYNYYRYYDPETGRYISSDPVGLKGGLNTYGYVGGNPVRFVDPLGLTQKDIDDALSLAKKMKPNWNFPKKIKTWKQEGKGGKTVRPIQGENEIYLDKKYLECLSDGDAAALLNSLLHELAHYNQSRSAFFIDKFRERFTGGASSDAQDQAERITWDEYVKISDFLKNRKNNQECGC